MSQQQEKKYVIQRTRQKVNQKQNIPRLVSKLQQQPKLKTSQPLQKVGQHFESIGNLVFDKRLLDRISKKCLLNKNEAIIILDHSHPQRRYVDSGNSIGEEDYFLIYNVDGKPVSQIQYGFHYSKDGAATLEISSETKRSHREKHYNTILRAITILLAPTMMVHGKPIVQIISTTQNPLSTYSLLKLGFLYKDSQHVVDANQKPFDVSWYSPSFNKKQQTLSQKQKRIQQQQKLFSYIDNIWEWDPDYFEIYMYLSEDMYPRAVQLAKNTLYRLHNCSIQQQG